MTNITLPQEWIDYIKPFAEAIVKDVNFVTEQLSSLVGEAGKNAIDVLQNEDYSSFEDIKAIFSEAPQAILKKAVAENLRKAEEPVSVENVAVVNLDALPQVPDDDSWLSTLKAGGELKVDQPVVISAIRAALANTSGLYDIPKTLVGLMESYAEELDDPVGSEFFKLRKLLTKRSYAEIFEALDVEGSFVTEARKKTFIRRLNSGLWPEVQSFHNQLTSWQDTWQQGAANPNMMFAAMTAMQTGGAMPPGMMQAPETDTLRDAAEALNESINSVFAGTGIVVSMALAYDAQNIKKVLENDSLPSQIGAANREQMLKKLNVNVSADYVRLETNITKYVLAILGLSKVSAGNEETSYLGALLMLGNSIPWDKLSRQID
jgi:hypothetical protein